MQIYKFGGTSLANADRLRAVREIINDGGQKILVLSANGKTTDHLVALIDALENKNFEAAFLAKENLLQYYMQLCRELFGTEALLDAAQRFVTVSFIRIQTLFDQAITDGIKREIIANGELISTQLCSLFFTETGLENTLLNAPDIIQKNTDGQVDFEDVKRNLEHFMTAQNHPNLIITQGFICADHHGKIDNLGRGGSDFSATIFGNAAGAGQIQIWSDVDGFLNNDPGFVNDSLPLDHLSFDEAAELAYFGARILHPMSLFPAKVAGIPVLLKNTLNPGATGTLISTKTQYGKIKAVAAKDGITTITIHSGRMLLAYGFLKKIFEVFETYRTPVDMVTTSEVSVSVTIDNNTHLEEILAGLKKMGNVGFKENQSIVCVVGDSLSENRGQVARIFASLDDISIRMISYGAAKNSISFLVDSTDKTNTLRALQQLIPHQTKETVSYA